MLSFRMLKALQDNNKQTAELQRLTRDDKKVVSQLTEEASEDAKTLKTITILTLIYLPATFVAVSLISSNSNDYADGDRHC